MRGIAEQMQPFEAHHRPAPERDIIDREIEILFTPEVAQNVKADCDPAMLADQVRDLRLQPRDQRPVEDMPPRIGHVVAVARQPLRTGRRTGRALDKRQGEDPRALPGALSHQPADLALIYPVDQQARRRRGMLDRLAEERRPVDDRRMLRAQRSPLPALDLADPMLRSARRRLPFAHINPFP